MKNFSTQGRSIDFHAWILSCTLIFLSSCAYQQKTCDLIVHNALIYTVDDNFKMAQAMAIQDGRIVAIGAEREIMNEYSADEVIDARTRPVFPGFIDAHCHFLGYASTLKEADLTGTANFGEVVARLQKHAENTDHSWILGRGWDQNDWKADYLRSLEASGGAAADSGDLVVPFPDCRQLDLLFPNKPVALKRIDGHAMLVNSVALKLAGINEQTTVAGGIVVTDQNKCTGLLIDNAMTLVERIIPEYTPEQKREALLQAQDNCFAKGLTTVDDAGLMKVDIDLIDSMQTSGLLKMRVYAMLSDSAPNYEYYLSHGIDTTSDRLTVRAFKFYADGALGSRGACLMRPYADILRSTGRKDYGMMLSDQAHFRKRFADAEAAGFQVCTHAIGDSANRVILGLYGEALGGINDHRWRIEHAQVVSPPDLALFGKFSVIPSVQPTHATSDKPWAGERLGRSFIRTAYAYKDLKDQLGLVALGTDFPVEDISPFATFYAAVFRRASNDPAGESFQSENALTREEALRGMTIWAALSNFEETKKGSLEVGKWADFVILDRDIMKIDADYILKTRVMLTVIGGEKVYTEPMR